MTTPIAQESGISAWPRAIRRDRKAAAGGVIVLFFVAVALVGPWLVGDPAELVGIPLQPPSSDHWLGTNGQGQDVLAQLVVAHHPRVETLHGQRRHRGAGAGVAGAGVSGWRKARDGSTRATWGVT